MSYVFGSDTIINLTTYHTLYIPAYIVNAGVHCINPPAGNYVLPGKFAGAIRNDHAARKTFIIPEQSSVEQLLYDFNWQVGDTITGYLAHPGSSAIDTVISIDSVLVGSNYRKRWFINAMYQVYLIEGVGSTYGLVEPVIAGVSDNDLYELNCFSQDNMPLYPSGSSTCPVLATINEVSSVQSKLIVYPNPAHRQLYLQLPSDWQQQYVEVFGIDGKLLLQERMVTDQGSTLAVSLPELVNGLYFITIFSIDKRLQSRFHVGD
jgi:hypothetical protein